MESSPRCPKCGQPVAAGTLHGLCPECLFRAGLTAAATAPSKPARFVAPTPAELAPVFPQLEIGALIGQGGMGAVYRARQPSLDRVIALKILAPQEDGDPGFAERFMREARALARLSHPNIVAVHEFGAAGPYHYFIMEHVDGVTLRHLLSSAKPTPREALAIVPQICDALQYAHDSGIVHRDIKPENILIDRRGAVKIADFGLAKLIGRERPEFGITGAQDVMGTPHYMAPEQVEHPLEVDHRADIYSLGVVLYQMLTGELPLGRFAPPSRKVQIDVRLDEVVLRALEKEPERRYQQASGLKAEVQTIAGSPEVRAEPPENRPAAAMSDAGRNRWFIMAAAWLVAGVFLWLHMRTVDDYLALAGRLGVRGNDAAAAPLQQIYPAFAADAQTWVRNALDLLEGDAVQLRHTQLDNAPHGRDVQLASAWAWCIAGAGKLHAAFTGVPLPRAVERATIWLNPAVHFLCILLMSAWAARYLGAIAGVTTVAALTFHTRMSEGFFPTYVDHHGLVTVAVFGLLLGAVVMAGGWGRRATPAMPVGSPVAARVRAGVMMSAVSGACGLWLDASTTVPALLLVGASALLVIFLRGRAARQQGAPFAGDVWRLWGRIGAVASVVAYLLEYFPSGLGLRLDGNHPLYALAWWGGGELIGWVGERWAGDAEAALAGGWRWVLPVLALAVVPLTLLVGGARVFPFFDPFVASLHLDYVAESRPLWATIRDFEPRTAFDVLQVGTLPVIAAIVTLLYRRRSTDPALWFAMLATAALTAIAWWQSFWLLNAASASIVLLLALLSRWTASLRPFVRWAIALVIVSQVFAVEATMRYLAARSEVTGRRVSMNEMANVIGRDIAAVLRASQPAGDIVLLASPNASQSIGYYGRFKALGTLFVENGEGLKAAAQIFSALSEKDAEAQIRRRAVTHIAMVEQENFIRPYHRLLQPSATNEETRSTFGYRLMFEDFAPSWLEPIPYELPSDLRRLNRKVRLFKVRPASPSASS